MGDEQLERGEERRGEERSEGVCLREVGVQPRSATVGTVMYLAVGAYSSR